MGNKPLPNKRLKLAGGDRPKGSRGLCPGGHGLYVHFNLRRRAGRPQLKRDPLGRLLISGRLLVKRIVTIFSAQIILLISFPLRNDATIALSNRRPHPLEGAQYCEALQRVRISPDSVGPLPTAASVALLRMICGGTPTTRHTEESAYPAVKFNVGGLTVLASQSFSKSLRPGEPADTWEVTGTKGLLPMDVPLNSTWAALRRAYGRAVGRRMDGIVVMFCRFPTMFLHLDADPDSVGPMVNSDFTRIPSHSRIARIIINRSGSGWTCAGAGNSAN